MRHFVLRRCARLTLYATLARCALACGADTDRGPPIGSPTGPIGPVISEAGAPSGGGNGNANTGGASSSLSGGALDTVAGGRDAFGVGGSNTPFGIAGSPSAFSGGSF